MGSDAYLIVGRIIRAHGIKGQVEIFPLTDAPQRFTPGTQFQVKPRTGDMFLLTIEKVVNKKNRIVATLEDVSDRNSAEALVGCELMISSQKGEKPKDSYWHHDIIGCRVETDTGDYLGLVSEIIRTGGNDVYVVGEGRQYMIPAIQEVIKSIDIASKLIIIRPIPGLLEL